ncbi:ATP synthase protein I [Marinobacter daqiaonensis]|uniref:ATP synthase protein I n=1 Tax=Marinobacter daqiaonensis TaxID=650891 RepID=A0A1I6IEQ9_9GAMM|nr:ATP synthase subunit I [Marinobacter daqiaonensis]SFR65178.1 ATP synthase protein I [Marinobacter daqiaonensis]
MARSGKRFNRVPLVRWFVIEFAAVAVMALLWATQGVLAGYSALVGGLIYLVPNTWFAYQVYKVEGARNMSRMVGNLFRAESIKLALTAVFFAAVFNLMEPIHVPALLFTFAVMVVMGAALRWFIRPTPQR